MLAEPGAVFIDRYEVQEYVAEGGMQQVFRAQDLSFNRTVALKIPKNDSAQKRFAQSARVSARIVHANVAKTLDYFELAGKGYLVEEFVEGKDLSKILKDDYEYFDPHLASHVFHMIAKGVAASHHAGVIHRDLKPNNVVIAGGPSMDIVKITDFGIAKMAVEEIAEAAEGGEASMSNSSTAMGALPYMAPEMIDAARSAGPPADIWSLGAILYRIISGKYPYGSGWGAMKGILSGNLPPKPSILNVQPQFGILAERLWRITQSCLQYDSSKRPSSDQLLELCGDLSYSDAPRRLGTVQSYRPAGRGSWGYLEADEGERVFYHVESCYGKRPRLQGRVNFACFSGEPCSRAFPVLPLRSGD
jgi:eukaryotic-like serine/threonine-protein kinase